jgi:hypothetical protein
MSKVRLIVPRESNGDHSSAKDLNIPPGLRKRTHIQEPSTKVGSNEELTLPEQKKKKVAKDIVDFLMSDLEDDEEGSAGEEEEDSGESDVATGKGYIMEEKLQNSRELPVILSSLFYSSFLPAAQTFTYKIAGTDAFASCVLPRDMPFVKWRANVLQALGIPAIDNPSLGWKFYNAAKTVLPDGVRNQGEYAEMISHLDRAAAAHKRRPETVLKLAQILVLKGMSHTQEEVSAV